jgi:hypothetical protein
MKKTGKRTKEAHVANTKYGMGDSYGTGIKQNMGKMRENYMDIPVGKKMGKLKKVTLA